MMKYLTWIFLFVLSANSYLVNAQPANEKYPEIGGPAPDMVLKEIQHFSEKEIALRDFKDQWLVLDFFTTGCTACFASLPKMNQLNKDFEGRVQVLMVGLDDGALQKTYDQYRKKLDLDLPVVYVSKAVFERFGITYVPHIVTVDTEGIVRAITGKITEDDLQALLDGKDPKLRKGLNVMERAEMTGSYDRTRPLLINGNGGADTAFLFRSVLVAWDGKLVSPSQDFIYGPYLAPGMLDVYKNRVQVIGKSLSHLYQMAYADTLPPWPDNRGSAYGKYWFEPVLELTDSSEFLYDYDANKNLYNYSLIVPPERATARLLQEAMRRDLQTYFGYRVTVETRKMPYWKLVATDKARRQLKTKGGEPGTGRKFPPRTGFSLVNSPVSSLIWRLANLVPFYQKPPISDETGITSHIDIEMELLATDDFNEVKEALKKNGLDLVKGEKEMKVVVVRDKK